MITNCEPLIIDYPYQALDLAGDLVLQTIERVNMIIPKLITIERENMILPKLTTPLQRRSISRSPYNRYSDIHFNLLSLKGGHSVVAEYYAALQSFNSDFSIHLPSVAATAIESHRKCDKLRDALEINKGRLSAYELCEFLFVEHADLNPYLNFMRGHLSAYTVVSLAVINLQLSLATELLRETSEFTQTSLNSTYYPGVVMCFQEMLASRK